MACSSVLGTAKVAYKAGVLTVSDSCFNKTRTDASGRQMCHLLAEKLTIPVDDILYTIVPDEKELIEQELRLWADKFHVDLVLTVGGTGFSRRDVTPEATQRVCSRQAPALAQTAIASCSRSTPHALLSRATCGIRGGTIIFNLPGSVKGSRECFMEVANILPHAIDQVKGHKAAVENVHANIQGHAEGRSPKSRVDAFKIALRNRICPYEMISSGDALKIVLDHSDLRGVEMKSCDGSVGYVSAEIVTANIPSPPFRASIKDGYAILSGESPGALEVLGAMTAGGDPEGCTLEPGGCVRVSTGSPVPLNAGCVVQVEDTIVIQKSAKGDEELEIEIQKVPKPGEDIREVGSDIAVEEIIIPKNKEITPFDCGIMAASGIKHLVVYSSPRVAILSTGDELVEPGEHLKPGCIVDSNKPTLCAVLQDMKVDYFDAGIAKDSPDDLFGKLEHAFLNGDVIVITGGMSMGEKDYVKDVLKSDFSAEMHFGRIRMKPGKPTGFFTAMYKGNKKLIFCLPGNPVSASITFHLFVVPCLRKMMGHKNITQLTITAKLAEDVTLDPRPEYHRVSLTWEQDEKPFARSTGSQLSCRLLSLREANALMLLPARKNGRYSLKAGSDVQVMLFNYFAPHRNIFYI